jgi:hypothetical protein
MNPDQSNDSVDTTTTENNSAESHEIKEWQQDETQEPEQTQEETQEPEKKEPDQEEPKRSRAKERIEALSKRAAEAERKLAEYEAKQQKTEIKRPDFADFEDFSEYQKAEQQYFVDVAKAEFRAEMQQQQTSQAEAAQNEKFQAAILELEEDGVDVVSALQKSEKLPPLPIYLDQFDLSPTETLRLAKDLIDDEATYIAISQMNPVQAAVKINQIIEGRKTKTAPPVSNAPRPIKPVQANASATRDPSKMSDEEWYKAETQKRKGK